MPSERPGLVARLRALEDKVADLEATAEVVRLELAALAELLELEPGDPVCEDDDQVDDQVDEDDGGPVGRRIAGQMTKTPGDKGSSHDQGREK